MPPRKRRRALAVLAAALLMVPLFAQRAAAQTPATFRVGYVEGGNFMCRDARGEYAGYSFEFLQEICEQSGMSYEVVDAESWPNAVELIMDGGIDVLPGVYRTAERESQMLLTEQSICTIYTTLNVRSDDTRYDYEDFAAFQGMRVGIIRGSEDGENFKRYCEEHGVELTVVDYDETAALLGALEGGELDGAAITHLGRRSTFRVVASFAPKSLYIAVPKERPDLLDAIDQAIGAILLRDPGYEMDLYDKYLAPGVNQAAVLTREELEYIKTSGPVRVSYDPTYAPLTYRGADGTFRGVVADLFQWIAEQSGLTFTFEAASAQASIDALKRGDTDVLCVAESDHGWCERNGINSTLDYLSTSCVMIRNGADQITTLALPEGYQLAELIEENNPDKQILSCDSVVDCFNAVLAGTAQATYTNSQVANYLLSDPKYESLSGTTVTQYANNYSIGVSRTADPRLFSILDKYTQHIAREQIDDLLLKNTVVFRPVSVTAFARQHVWLITGLVAAVLGSVIALLGIILYSSTRSKRRIQDLLYRDTLTGMDNLNRFLPRAEALLRENPSGRYALLYGDINRFKLVNDTFGFSVGDRVLCAFGQALWRAMRDGECCARLAADNFVLLMGYEDWDALTDRVREIGAEVDRWRREDGTIPYELGFSYGAYQITREERHSLQQMLDLANYARHRAKDARDGIFLYDEKMRQMAFFELELDARITAALDRREFLAYYQPKVNMATGALVGSEALLRWNHPDYGLLMPGAFLPFLEKKGMIVRVDLYVFETVCRDIREWLSRGLPVTPVSCNFSRLHFVSPGFAARIAEIADRYEVPHGLLEVEITESTIADVPDGLGPIIAELKRFGFLVAIDDFGSGYSSLGQLQQLQADVLKLDRSFVVNGLQERREQIVVEHLVHMVHELGMSVICEGVETQAQADKLQRMGCLLAQGYYYYRPMPREDFERLIPVWPAEALSLSGKGRNGE